MRAVSTSFLVLVGLLTVACGAPSAAWDDEAVADEAALRALTPAEVLGEIHFGETRSAIPYTRRPRFRAFWFMASAGDQIAVTATSSSGSASVLVADDTFTDVPGNATATLTKSGKYYVAVRDSAAKVATLTVSLARTNVATSAKVADVSVGPYGTCALLLGAGGVRCWGRTSSDYFTYSNFRGFADKTPANAMPADHRFLPSHRAIGFDFAGPVPRSWQTAIESSQNDYSQPLVYGDAFFKALDGTSPLALLSSDCAWFPGRIRCRKQSSLFDFDFDQETFAAGAVGSTRSFACAITTTGDLKCWGNNAYGRLGTGDVYSRGVGDPDQDAHADLTLLEPIALGVGAKVAAAALGDSHACALLTSGAVKCWGKGGQGQLGGASRANVGSLPTDMGNALPALALGGTGKAVFAFDDASCVALADGHMKCFGDALPYPLVTEMAFPSPVKKLVLSGSGATYAMSAQHACALLEDGSLRCWGSNQFGALGVPVAITSLAYDAAVGAASLAPIEIP